MKPERLFIFSVNEQIDNLMIEFLTNQYRLPIQVIRSSSQMATLGEEKGLLIFHSSNLKDEDFKFLLLSGKVPMRVCIGDNDGIDELHCVSSPLKINQLFNVIEKEYQLNSIKDDVENDYFPVKISLFNYLSATPCDVFLRLGKPEDGYRYVKRLYGNHSFEQEEIRSFIEKKIEFFYIQGEDKDYFFNFLVDKITPSKVVQEKGKRGFVEINSDIHTIMEEVVKKTTLDQEMFNLANQSIKNMASTIQSSNKLLGLLKELLRSKGSFNYKHCFLNSIFCFEIMKRMDLGKTSRLIDRHEMICFVAFYHDILLKDEKLVRIRNKKEFFRAELTKVEKDLVNNHAKIIADLMGEIRGTPSEASQILRMHHGMTNGIGFPSAYSASLPAFAIMFIVVEFFVFQILDPSENDANLSNIFSICDKEFPLPSYRKVVAELKKVFKFKA